MGFSFEVTSVLVLEHTPGAGVSKHKETKFNLSVSRNLDGRKYIAADGQLTAEGSRCVTNVLVQALIGNLHMAHQNGHIDSAAHLRSVISELERGFVAVVKVEQSTF